MFRRLATPLLLAGLALAARPAVAGETFTAVLDGPTAGTPSPATGLATLVLDDTETLVEYVVTYQDLLGVEGFSHFHNAAPGRTGKALLTLPPGTPKVGTWEVTAFEVGELRAGRIYVNVHTDLYGGGEIRGDIMPSGVSAAGTSWGAIKSLFR